MKKCPVCKGTKHTVVEEYVQPPGQIRRCECGHEYHVDLIDLTHEEVNKPENCPLCKKPADEQSLGEFMRHKKFHQCPDFRMPTPLPDGELPDKKEYDAEHTDQDTD